MQLAFRTWIVRARHTARMLMQMTRENKLALVVGFGLILLVGVLISDHFSTARSQQSADFAANRPVDPLSEMRRSDPELIDLQNRREATTDALRSPLAMNTTQMQSSTPAGSEAAAADPPADPGVRRVVMGEPVEDAADATGTTRPAASNNVPYIFHDVRPGETMTSIAQRYYGDATLVHALAAFNGLDDPNSLRVNHRLRIPASGDLGEKPDSSNRANSTPRNVSQTKPTQPQQVYTTYTVQRGDTLSELSLELLGTSRRWRELYELNKDAIRDPDNLLAGTVLKVPKP